jgi:hypothetical protein
MGLLARWLLVPALARLPLRDVLFWLTLLVPVLLIAHFMIYVRLLKPVAESTDAAVV